MGRFAAQNFLPRECCNVQLVPWQVHREGSRCCIAQCQAVTVRRDRIAIRHTHARSRAVPGKANIVVIVQARHVHYLAVVGGVNGMFNFQLLNHISYPARAEGFPCNHLCRAFTQQRPHRHFKGTSVRGWNDTDFIIGRNAKNVTCLFNCGKQFCLADSSAV